MSMPSGLWAVLFWITSLGWTSDARAELPRLLVDSVLNLGTGVHLGLDEVSHVKTLRVVNASGEPGNYFLTFSVPSGGVGSRRLVMGNAEIPYQIYRNPTSSIPLKDFPDVRVGEVLMGRFGDGDVQHVLEFSIRANSGAWLPPGTYSDSIVIRLFSGTIDDALEVESNLVQVQQEIATRSDLALVNSGGLFAPGMSLATLDFGLIQEEVERSIECVVRSNVGYRLSFFSDNGGRLLHKSGFHIPYTLFVDGVPLPLIQGGDSMLNTGFTETIETGRSHGLGVHLRPSPDQTAGDYADNIRISVWTE